MKYTHGQKVTCEMDGMKIKDAKVSINKNGTIHVCQDIKSGTNEAENMFGYKHSWRIKNVSNLRPAEKSFDYPEVGDEYVERDGDSRFVLGVAGRVIFLSASYDKDKFIQGYTKEELIRDGYTIKQDTPIEEVLEFTLDEVAEKFGIDSKKIRIKE